MAQRPVALVAGQRFEDDGQAEIETGLGGELAGRDVGVQADAVASDLQRDNRMCLWLPGHVALPVGIEAIGRPARRWREIEFAIDGFAGCRHEGLATGVLPQAVGRFGRGRGRQAQRAYGARDAVFQLQSAVGCPRSGRRDGNPGWHVVGGMAVQRVEGHVRRLFGAKTRRYFTRFTLGRDRVLG